MAILSGVLRQCISWNIDRFCRVHNRDDDVIKLYFLMLASIAMMNRSFQFMQKVAIQNDCLRVTSHANRTQHIKDCAM